MRLPLGLIVLGAFAIALCALPGALALDGNDVAANATPIAPGLNGPYDIDPTGDIDWYSFSLNATSEVRLETNGSSGDSVLYLYDANLTQLAYDDDGGVGLWSRIVRQLNPGNYFALVEELGNSGTIYGYYLTLQADPPFPLVEGLNGPFNASPEGMANLFTFDVNITSSVRLELNGSAGDPVMYLFDANFTQLAYDDDSGVGLFSKIVHTLRPGTYFARVQPLSSYSTVLDYYFTLERTSLAGADGNGVMDNATPIGIGVNGPYDINPVGDLDWYVITFASDGIAQFTTNGSSGATLLSFYDMNGTWLAQDYTSGPGSFSFLEGTVSATTYFVLVQQAYGSSTISNYTVEVEVLPMPAPDSNNDVGNATVLAVGVSGPYSLVRGDVDWYSFDAAVPGTLTVEANGVVGGTQITLLDTAGVTLAYGSSTYNASFQRASALVDLGTYFIRVQLPYGIGAVSNYNLTVTFTPWTSLDGNDFRSTAQRLHQGLNGPYSISPYNDIDWYYFDQSENGTALVEVFGGAGYASLELLNATGYHLSGGPYGTQQVSMYLQPARYFVRMTSTYSSYVVPSYNLNLTLPDHIPPPLAMSGPGNGSSTDAGAVRVSGTTEPGSRVWVDGSEVVVDENGTFSAAVILALGQNTITILSRDPAGNEAFSTLVVTGVDANVSLTAQLAQANAQLASTQQQLASAQAAAAASATQASDANTELAKTRSQLDTTNGTLIAAREEADGQRGIALLGMVLAAGGIAAAVGVAFTMRRRPEGGDSAGTPSTPVEPAVGGAPPKP